MPTLLQALFSELKQIRTYLIKIGPTRRKGNILVNKLEAANSLYEQYNNWVEEYKGDESEILEYCNQFELLYQSIVELCQSDKASEVNMPTFDLKTALHLMPCMNDTEANTKQLIDNIEYYDSLLDTEQYFGMQLSNLFVDLTISQAEGNSNKYEILKPLNEKIAIKRFADGLRNRRLSTIIAARNFNSLKDAIQAAQDEEVSSSSGSGEIMVLGRKQKLDLEEKERNQESGAW
ncbi:uncharacterized protein LOC132904069 [Amyelois transitella]|uniref:uncharacterized protein LOC132904069 n=1 Tax=Amyelois transitella TaxID=680683 RepID=UPI00299003EE|nr:uncharacterized protein LOC132904069 [Amyelois transitella]